MVEENLHISNQTLQIKDRSLDQNILLVSNDIWVNEQYNLKISRLTVPSPTMNQLPCISFRRGFVCINCTYVDCVTLET